MKYITILLLLFLLISCKEDVFTEDEYIANSNAKQEHLEIKSIEYFIESDYEKLTEIEADCSIVENNTDFPITFTANPYAKFSDFYYFANKKGVYDFANSDSLYIEIPSYINDLGIIMLSDAIWKFSFKPVLKTQKKYIEDVTIIEPYTKVSITYHVIQKEYVTGFDLIYMNKLNNNQGHVVGTWHGFHLEAYRKEVTIQKIK